jgi:hypothetical protein
MTHDDSLRLIDHTRRERTSMRLLTVFAAAAAGLALTMPGVSTASGGTFSCNNVSIGGPFDFVDAHVIDANVDVPAGSYCSLWRVEVTGNVTVEGTLGGFGSTYDKNVIVNGGYVGFTLCLSLLCGGVGGNHVYGNLVVAGGGATLTARIEKNVIVDGANGVGFEYTTVGGNVSVANSTDVGFFDVGTPGRPGIGGNLNLIGNTYAYPLLNVVIGGNLNCEANDPAPPLGAGVIAQRMNGQCSPDV